jgi:hypothetical protein
MLFSVLDGVAADALAERVRIRAQAASAAPVIPPMTERLR